MVANACAKVGPRERLVDVGVEALAEAELVSLILGAGRAGESALVLATRLLEELGGVEGLARAGAGELTRRRGVGAAKGARLAAAVELGRRVTASAGRLPAVRLGDARSVYAWSRGRLAELDHEELWILILDGRGGLRAARRVASGGLHGLSVVCRDPLRAALREGGAAFVLVHNHPSGDPTPSAEDVASTRRLVEAAALVTTPLLDHVVVTRDGFASMLELRLLDPLCA